MKRLGQTKNNKKVNKDRRIARARENQHRKLIKHCINHPNDLKSEKYLSVKFGKI
jgi:hypothetical protein